MKDAICSARAVETACDPLGWTRPIARVGGRLLVVLPWVSLPGEVAAHGLPYAVVNALNPTPWDLSTQNEIDEALQNLSDQIAAAMGDLEEADDQIREDMAEDGIHDYNPDIAGMLWRAIFGR